MNIKKNTQYIIFVPINVLAHNVIPGPLRDHRGQERVSRTSIHLLAKMLNLILVS